MDRMEIFEKRIKILTLKQNELILRLNEVIDKVNLINLKFKKEEDRLLRKEMYLEQDVERLKSHTKFPDEDI